MSSYKLYKGKKTVLEKTITKINISFKLIAVKSLIKTCLSFKGPLDINKPLYVRS